MRHHPLRLALLVTVLQLLTIPLGDARLRASQEAPAANAIGYEIDLDDLPSPRPQPGAPAPSGPDGGAAAPLHVRIGIPWSSVEKIAGTYDWAVLDQLIPPHSAAGYRVILQPRGANPLHPPLDATQPATVEPWTGFLRALAGRYRDQTGLYLLGGELAGLPPNQQAFLLKQACVTIQSADAGARIALGPLSLGEDSVSQVRTLLEEGVAPYLDAVAVAPGPPAQDLAALRQLLLSADPGAAIWISGARVPGGAEAGGRLLRAYLEGVRLEAALTLARVEFGPDGTPPLFPVMERFRQTFRPGLSPLVESGRGLTLLSPMGRAIDAATVRLFDPEAKKVLIAWDAGEGAARGEQAVLVIDSLDLADPVLKDVAAGESAPAGGYQMDQQAGLTRLAVPLAEYPLLLEYRRFTSPLFGEEEKLEITEKRLASVEEIIAKHQAFQAAQDALLVNLRADARIDYHFRIGTGSTVDITVLNTFYLDPKVGAEFEQREFYVNGVKWRSDRIPEFPIPQPEKVMTLPLDIALDRRYSYELAGEQTVDGFDCWMIDFTPLEEGGRLYKGRLWIDKATSARVQISSVQTGLAAPIVSNDEKDSYRPLRGPEGLEYWLLSRIDGQQVFTATGRNLIMVREVTLTNHVINDPDFEQRRSQAYASDHSILRDTPKGQRYLQKTPDGGRIVKDELDRDNLFLLGGVFYNRSLDFPIPLAGVNYFNRDLGGRGIQTNVFFGGVLMFANASDPSLFGSRLEASADLFTIGFSSTDKPVRQGREVEEENIDTLAQRVTLGVGLPFAEYWKLKLWGSGEYQGFARDEETDHFTVPGDTFVSTAGLEGEFNRNAWSVTGSIRSGRRSTWDCWGECDPATTGFDPEALDRARSFLRYEGSAAKDWFFPLNQKLHLAATVYGGTDLDRFSAYKFDFFGNRLRGFSGAGFRYTQGARAQVQYSFNLGEIIRFDASLDHARVRDRQVRHWTPLDEDGLPLPESEEDYKSFTGFGFSGQTILGPNLIVSLDWGIALASDIREFRGDQEILLTLLRLFH